MDPEFILNFWLDEVGPDSWYSFDDSLDGLIEQKFKETEIPQKLFSNRGVILHDIYF